MVQNKKYRSYGILRKNNMSDILNKEEALNNLLNNLPEVDEENGITFISQDLNAIRGIKDTDIGPSDFSQLAGTTPTTIQVDGNGVPVLNAANNIIVVDVNPLIRLEDRFRLYRGITEDPPIFSSGRGPTAYFIPSDLLPISFPKASTIDDEIGTSLLDQSVQVSSDFWVLGEFYINDRIRPDFADEYGGIMWEGYYLPNPSSNIQTFSYETSGLFHVEYDRFSDGNWQVLKSIYAKLRDVLVQSDATDATTIILQPGELVYISVGDFLSGNTEFVITSISESTNSITLSNEITVTAGQSLTFDMPLGISNTSGQYTINEMIDRGETPQMKKRIFWWFPETELYETESSAPEYRYLLNRISGRERYDFYFLNSESASPTPSSGSVRELIENAITPTQDTFNSQLKSSNGTSSLYTPKSLLSQITKGSSNISFDESTKSVTGNFSTTDIGNYIVPTAVADLETVVPKNMRVKDLFGSNSASNARLVNILWPVTRTDYPVTFIDHNGLVDYFVVTSSTDVVTILSPGDDTLKLRKDMYCVYDNTNEFIRITEIISPTSFRTSAPLGLTNSYVYIYANAGIIDGSLDVFCANTFGQTLTTEATSGTNTLTLTSIAGIETGMIVQFSGSIAVNTDVSSIAPSSNTITLSTNLIASIDAGSTIVFTPAGTTVNKEICVLPLDLSPPFVGVPTGLDTDENSIRSSKASFNVKVGRLTASNISVSSANTSNSYDTKIDLANTSFSIIGIKVV